jgi:TonB family protein
MDAYSTRVNAAIQAAVVCPLAAQNMNMSGRTRIQFKLQDALASDSSVATISGKPMLDTAALAAVQAAKYPTPPAELAGQLRAMMVTVVLNCGN